MRILWDNQITGATITPTTVNAAYPITNLQDVRLKKIYKSTADSAQRLVITGPFTASYFAILGHNLTSAATVKIEGNDTNSWGSPSFSETMVYDADIMIADFTEATYNYWSLYIDDAANPDTVLEIGYLFLSTYLQMPKMARNQEIPKTIDSNQIIGKGGQVYGTFNYSYRGFTVNFNYLTNAQRGYINSMFDACGDVTPVILIPWESDTTFESIMYCIINQKTLSWKRTNSQNLPWSISINFREVF